MKKSVALLSVAALSVVAVAPVSANVTNFVDLTDRTLEEQQNVKFLVESGIVNGTSATTFTPNKEITRGQVVKMLGRYLIENEQAQAPVNWQTKQRFEDVPLSTADRELLKMAAICYETGIFQGSNGKLNASGTLSRENMALVMNRLAAFTLDGQDLASYVKQNNLAATVSDLQLAKAETQPAITALNALGISVVAQFNPKSTVKRIHLTSFLSRLLQKLDEIEAVEAEGTSGDNDVIGDDQLPPTGNTTSTGTLPDTDINEEEPDDEEEWIDEEEEEWIDEEEEEEEEWIDEEEEEYIPEYIIDADYLTGVVNTSTAQQVVVNGYTFKVAEELQTLFAQQELMLGADVTLFIEEDVITSVTNLTINNTGVTGDPVNLDGSWLDDETIVTMKSLYGHVINMDYYDEDSFMIQPSGTAYYDVYEAAPALNGTNGTLYITYHQDVDYLNFTGGHIVLTVMDGVTVSELTTSGVPTIITYGSGELDSLIVSPYVAEATINGYVNMLEIGAYGGFYLYGTGTVLDVFGEASQLIVSPTLTIDYIDLPNVPEPEEIE